MPYLPITDDDRRRMLRRVGVSSIEELLDVIPEKLRHKEPLEISSLPEMELLTELRHMAREDRKDLVCFAGGGVYDHFIPAAVSAVATRPEFMTAYTPYQPEVAQGTLQVIYEFQTHICRLTGLDVSNASLYDGATAAAEAVILAARATRRDRIVVSDAVNPMYRDVITTYLSGRDMELVTVPSDSTGRTDPEQVASEVNDQTAAVLVAQPNFFGMLEEVEALCEKAHEHGAKFIMSVDPVAQAILKTPGEIGADIVVGEGQPLGLPLNFGGPLLGFMAAHRKLIRMMPGRIAGRTRDVEDRPGYVLTLQTREQHIRRDKATSNICTNQALCATMATVYMTLMGRAGLKQVALLSAEKAQKLHQKLTAIEGVEAWFGDAPFVREFALKLPASAREIILDLIDQGILIGVNAGRWYDNMDDCLIVAATEKRTDEQIEQVAQALEERIRSREMSQV
jgi:glycine dehydrogenase subunit 1